MIFLELYLEIDSFIKTKIKLIIIGLLYLLVKINI